MRVDHHGRGPGQRGVLDVHTPPCETLRERRVRAGVIAWYDERSPHPRNRHRRFERLENHGGLPRWAQRGEGCRVDRSAGVGAAQLPPVSELEAPMGAHRLDAWATGRRVHVRHARDCDVSVRNDP